MHQEPCLALRVGRKVTWGCISFASAIPILRRWDVCGVIPDRLGGEKKEFSFSSRQIIIVREFSCFFVFLSMKRQYSILTIKPPTAFV